MADFVAVLAEIDRLELFATLGYSSLFAMCVERWRYSEPAAARRVRAARLARRHLEVLSFLRAGDLNLETASLLEAILKGGRRDAAALLEQAKGKTIRQVEALIAKVSPRPDLPDVVRAQPAPGLLVITPGGVGSGASTSLGRLEIPAASDGGAAPGPDGVLPTAPPASEAMIPRQARSQCRLTPLSELRVHFSFTGSSELRRKLDRLRDLQRHKYPEGRLEQVIEDAVDRRLRELDPDLWAASRPPSRIYAPSRRIPKSIKREVWRRDQGMCAFVASDGTRCGARAWLEYDHVVPAAIGGPSTAENLRLLCRNHNQWRGKRLHPV